VAANPTNDELIEFIGSMLSNLDGALREPQVLAQALAENRELWLSLYAASLDFDPMEAADAGNGPTS